MQLHQFSAVSGGKTKRRVGRGGKRGTTSGRGQKGQKSRSGHSIRPAQRDLIIRLPKLRGFRNKPKSGKTLVLNLSDINRLKSFLGTGTKPAVLDRKTLQALKVISPRYRGKIKILGNGALDFAVRVKGIKLSKSVRKKLK